MNTPKINIAGTTEELVKLLTVLVIEQRAMIAQLGYDMAKLQSAITGESLESVAADTDKMFPVFAEMANDRAKTVLLENKITDISNE